VLTIFLVSTADTELLAAAASGAGYLTANPARIAADDVTGLAARADLVVLRLLGGRKAWPQGVAALAATLAAAGTPGLPAAKAAEETTKATAATTMGSTITSAAGGADIHTCATLLPAPPHGPGVVITGSMTVLINNLPACRQGDTILEAVGPPNTISMGLPTVIIGDSMYVGQGGALAMAAQTGAPFCEH